MNQTNENAQTGTIRTCDAGDVPTILRIINLAAEAYRGAIPPDRWHDPYMPLGELQSEMAEGVAFSGVAVQDELVGVMGIQHVKNVRLVRHAYVLPEWQGRGVGSRLISHLLGLDEIPVLIGTWAAASWAIRFYQRHGFELVPEAATGPLLKTYWHVPERQIATSVVLALPALSEGDATRLMAERK